MDAPGFATVPLGRWLFMDDGSPVPGWYDYGEFWRRAVETAPPGSLLVEVGVFCGRSLLDLANLARAAGKGLRVAGVDNFRGSPEHAHVHAGLPKGVLAREAWVVLDEHGALPDVCLVTADSARAAALFADGSAWAVFLDADHSEAAVCRDVSAWLPKVAPGGWLGGHDYWTFPGVRAAVDRLLPGAATDAGRSWWELRKEVGRG